MWFYFLSGGMYGMGKAAQCAFSKDACGGQNALAHCRNQRKITILGHPRNHLPPGLVTMCFISHFSESKYGLKFSDFLVVCPRSSFPSLHL